MGKKSAINTPVDYCRQKVDVPRNTGSIATL